jgi:hypothetical protein
MVRELLVTDPGASGARPTKDVDCVVDLPSLLEFHRFSSSLRSRGFAECTDEGAPICRWVVNRVHVDVMPIDPVVLGFSNVWYPSGVEHALRVTTPEGSIRIVNAVHFCATKVESFLARGEGDFFHHDMEDLLEIVNSRHELVDELAAAPADVREFLADTFEVWLADTSFLDALPGHLPGDAANQARVPILLARLRKIASLRSEESAKPAQWEAKTPRLGQQALGPDGLPTRVPLRSSNLNAASYDAGSSTLTIEFHGGRTYDYLNVPATVYAGLIAAASHGRYFHQWIKGRYQHLPPTPLPGRVRTPTRRRPS